MRGDALRIRTLVVVVALLAALSLTAAQAQTIKVGVINSYSGFVAQAADEMQKGIDLYVKLHEKDLPAGIKLELIKRDDTSNPEVGKRLAQELITRDQVQLLMGMILSPVAAAVAPLTAEAKVPLVLTNAAGADGANRSAPGDSQQSAEAIGCIQQFAAGSAWG